MLGQVKRWMVADSQLLIQLVSRCFEPNQPQRFTSGLTQTSICLGVIHSPSHYTTGLFLLEPQLKFYPQF